MGTYIYLDLAPDRVEPDAWASFYDQSVLLLQQHPVGLLSRRVEKSSTGHRELYSRRLEFHTNKPEQRHWLICGDATSRRVAEWFYLYRDVGVYRRGLRCVSALDDIVARLATSAEGVTARVFQDNTGGLPYHVPMLAVAMLAEDLFPQGVFVGGNIQEADARAAATYLETMLKRPFSLPLCLTPERLWARLRQFQALEQAVGTFQLLFRGRWRDRLSALLPSLPLPDATVVLRMALQSLPGARLPGAQLLFIEFLNAGGSLELLLQTACLDSAGPKFLPEAVLDSLAACWLTQDPVILKALTPPAIPAEQANGIWAMILTVLQELGPVGRQLNRHMRQQDIAPIVRSLFPEKADKLLRRLRDATLFHRDALGEVYATERELLERRFWAAQEIDPQRLLSISCIEDIPKSLAPKVHQFMLQVLERQTDLLPVCPVPLPPEIYEVASRRRVIRLLESHYALTEEAWAELEQDTAPEMLRFLIALTLCDHYEPAYAEMRTLLLENAPLRRALIARAQIVPPSSQDFLTLRS